MVILVILNELAFLLFGLTDFCKSIGTMALSLVSQAAYQLICFSTKEQHTIYPIFLIVKTTVDIVQPQ